MVMFVGVFVYPGWSVRDTCYFMENQQNVPSSYYKVRAWVASVGYNRRMLSQVETYKTFTIDHHRFYISFKIKPDCHVKFRNIQT